MKRPLALLSAAILVAGLASVASPAPVAAAGIVFDGSPGYGPPPATLGGYPMTPFGPDGLAYDSDTMSVPAPGAGSVGFSVPMIVGAYTWWPDPQGGGWTPGYTGHLYFERWTLDPLVLTLPAATRAFYFYAVPRQCPQPGDIAPLTITATTPDGATSGPMTAHPCAGIGARYFGFYATGGTSIASITIRTNAWGILGVVVGEFGIYRSTGTSPLGPVVASFSPPAGRVGSLVTIAGRNLAYATAVRFEGARFDGIPAVFSVRSPTLIVATVPAGAKTGPIRVRSPYGTASTMRSFMVLVR